jgi:hypothetical protein
MSVRNWVIGVVFLVFVVPTASAQTEEPAYSLVEVVGKSMFGKQPDPDREWTPLTIRDFSEGWFEPWIAPPAPSGGSLRQGWVNTFDAFFNRMIVGIYSYANATGTNRDEQVATLLWETPITRRYLFGVFVPVVDSLQNGAAPQATAFGDVTIENRFILQEVQDRTVSFNLNVQVPTGDSSIGGNRTLLMPYLSAFQGVGHGVSIRGTVGVDVPVDSRPDGVSSTLFQQLGVGQTLTPHDVPLFGDFTYYATMNVREFNGTGGSFLSVTPGFRTHLGRDFWLLGGVEVPLTGPHPFEERLTFLLVKGY